MNKGLSHSLIGLQIRRQVPLGLVGELKEGEFGVTRLYKSHKI